MSNLSDIAAMALTMEGVGPRERRVLSHIADCRTERMGGNIMECACGAIAVHYNSCRDRHCPLCQGAARARWVHDRLAELLPCPYFHVVFTVPHHLIAVAMRNRHAFYSSLFRCAHQTLQEVCANPANLGAIIGGLSILHTWNQKLGYHPHIHCVVPSGGLSLDASRWIPGGSHYLVSVKKLSAVFRGKILHCLERDISKRIFGADSEHLKSLLGKASTQNFVVYAKRPFGSSAQVLKYLGLYTHRVGISEQRIVRFADAAVTYSYLDRKNGYARRRITLSHADFIHRFLLHILPKGLRKIRYFGFMGNRDRHASLARIRTLLGIESDHNPDVPVNESIADTSFNRIGTEEPPRCPRCGRPMHLRTLIPAYTTIPAADYGMPGFRADTPGPEPNRVSPAV
jgi:hypothetical protein